MDFQPTQGKMPFFAAAVLKTRVNYPESVGRTVAKDRYFLNKSKLFLDNLSRGHYTWIPVAPSPGALCVQFVFWRNL
jgi:hypothetical protein